MKSKFEPDSGNNDDELNSHLPAGGTDPDAYDASEEQFAASLEETPAAPPKFVVESGPEPAENPSSASSCPSPVETVLPRLPDSGRLPTSPQSELLPPPDSESWRLEVAARLNSYRAKRRPRTPRYPSLKLKFEPNQPTTDSPSDNPPPSRQAITTQSALPDFDSSLAQPVPDPAPPQVPDVETTGKLIEFPRSSIVPPPYMPPRWLNDLAEPVVDRPRILEAPEFAPPPPALGGILIEPVEVPAHERRPGFEMPLQSAPLARRLAATAVDALIVLLAVAGFAYIVLRIIKTVPPLATAAGMAIAVTGLLWAGYQYLLLVRIGTTPGLRIAKLRLSMFDGSPVPRKVRAWRVLASILSGVSVGLGYAWCFLDEDQLCWHDRITRTYMAPSK